MPSEDVEASIDELYSLAPEEFTAARDALAKQLRTTDKEAAAAVKGLRRPTVAAWAVNQAVRRRPELLDTLEEAADAARRAQQGLLSGRGATAVREATATRRSAVAALTDAAVQALSEAGRPASDSVQAAISDTFDAAAIDDEARAALRAGRLAKELEPKAGFGGVGGFTLLSGGEDTTSPEEDQHTAEAEEDAVRSAEIGRLQHLAERAERDEARTAKDAERAVAEVERIERDLERARSRAEKARADAARASAEADAARQALTAIQSEDDGS